MVSKLQELLAAKKGQTNGQVTGSQVVQPKAEPQAQMAPQAPSAKKPSILDKLKHKSNSVVEQRPVEGLKDEIQRQTISSADQPGNSQTGNNASVSELQNGSSDNKNSDATAEKIMPPGLTMMQQMKWKKEHAVKAEAKVPANQPGNSQDQTVSERPSSEPIRSESNSQSASRAADDQKTNDGSADVAELKSNLKYLADNIENRELVAQVVRTIAMQVAQHPEIAKHMLRGEVNLMVRGLRSAYQVAAMSKQARAETKKKGDKQVDELAQMFKDMGVNMKFN